MLLLHYVIKTFESNIHYRMINMKHSFNATTCFKVFGEHSKVMFAE